MQLRRSARTLGAPLAAAALVLALGACETGGRGSAAPGIAVSTGTVAEVAATVPTEPAVEPAIDAVAQAVEAAEVVEAVEAIEAVAPDAAPDPWAEPAEPVATYDLADLPKPGIARILPAGLPTAAPEDARGLIARPYQLDTAGFSAPDDSVPPVLNLQAKTDLGNGGEGAGWAVVGERPGWVQVLVPVGRGALASKNPAQVNHHTAWVRDTDVQLDAATKRIVVDVVAHELAIYDAGSTTPAVTFHVGVGIKGKTPTPRGLCAVSGHITTQSGAKGLVTSCQSEVMDSFKGASFAATAIHQGTGFDPATGAYVSNGCIRVPAAKFTKYLSDIPTGTVVIFE